MFKGGTAAIGRVVVALATLLFLGGVDLSVAKADGRAETVAYAHLLSARVKSKWRWHRDSPVLVAKVRLTLLPNGEFSDIVIEKGSGSKEFDDSVLDAVAEASPVPPPPRDAVEQFGKLRFTFDSRE